MDVVNYIIDEILNMVVDHSLADENGEIGEMVKLGKTFPLLLKTMQLSHGYGIWMRVITYGSKVM